MLDEESKKWEIVKALSQASNDYGDKIDDALCEAGVTNTQQLTAEQAESYCIRHGIPLIAKEA